MCSPTDEAHNIWVARQIFCCELSKKSCDCAIIATKHALVSDELLMWGIRSTLTGTAPAARAATCWPAVPQETIHAASTPLRDLLQRAGRMLLGQQLQVAAPVPRLSTCNGTSPHVLVIILVT